MDGKSDLMKIIRGLVNFVIKVLISIACRIDANELNKVANAGPLILATNHINFLEIPLVYLWMQPRPLYALIKIETIHHPFFGFLADSWGGIPVRRGEFDRSALVTCIKLLEDGNILAISLEGTRSGDGKLLKGYPGVIPIALKSAAPIQPVVFYGHENFWKNVVRLKRTDFKIVVGEPFMIKDHGLGMSREVRQEIVDQIMFRLAMIMPEKYRGVYSDLDMIKNDYFDFLPPGDPLA